MAEQDDVTLLNAVAKNRDREAFARLVERHQQAAYSLALHITAKPELAEETFQEAMLRVWLSAGTFDARGSVRGWILRIVSRQSLKALRGKRKELENVQFDDELNVSENALPSDAAEKGEIVTALRNALEELPVLERRILALYFGGGISHDEIGKAFSIPQRTISFRIKKALEQMRATLTRTGYAAALPLLTAENLGRALGTGSATPPGLCQAAVSHALQAPAQVAAQSVRAKAALQAGWGLPAALAAGAGIVGVAGAIWVGHAQTPATEAPVPVVVQAAQADAPVQARWDFKDGPPKDFTLMQGEWAWERPADSPGHMVASGDTPVVLALPLKMPKQPLLITIKTSLSRSGFFRGGAVWMQRDKLAPCREWNKHLELGSIDSALARWSYSIYFFDRYLVSRLDLPGSKGGFTSVVSEHQEPYPSDRIAVFFQNANIEEIEVRSISLEEIPAEVRDVKAAIAKMGVEAQELSGDGHSMKPRRN